MESKQANEDVQANTVLSIPSPGAEVAIEGNKHRQTAGDDVETNQAISQPNGEVKGVML
jgi:hypothetical protein